MNDLNYADRHDAGVELAQKLRPFATDRTVVLALVRGGVPVAYEVACELGVPLDVMLVRKLTVPEHPELAAGAIASGGIVVLNDSVVSALGLTDQTLSELAADELRALELAEDDYRADRPAVQIARRSVILVDDGLATGSTMRAAIEAARARQPREIIVAAPVGSSRVCTEMAELVDHVVCPVRVDDFRAVSRHYDDFGQLHDDDVRGYLDEFAGARARRVG